MRLFDSEFRTNKDKIDYLFQQLQQSNNQQLSISTDLIRLLFQLCVDLNKISDYSSTSKLEQIGEAVVTVMSNYKENFEIQLYGGKLLLNLWKTNSNDDFTISFTQQVDSTFRTAMLQYKKILDERISVILLTIAEDDQSALGNLDKSLTDLILYLTDLCIKIPTMKITVGYTTIPVSI